MQLQGSVQWVIDGLMGFLDALFTPLANAMGQILADIADFTVLVPHPEWTTANQVMSAPSGGLWLTLWEFHWTVMVPASLAVLITSWFARQGGVAANLISVEQSARSRKSMAKGFGLILISWWLAGAYLNLAHALTQIITPDAAAMTAAIPELSVASVGIAAAFYYLELTVGSTLFVLLILVNVIRLIGSIAFVILFPMILAVVYGKIPVMSDLFKSFGNKLATTALWTIPVAAGWRVMAILGGSDEGILESVLSSSGIGVGVVDSVINPFLIMIPALIGIASPFLMSNVSQMYYLSNMADVNLGADAAGVGSGAGGGAGSGAGVGSGGPGGGPAGSGGSTRVNEGQNTLGDYGQGDGRTSSDIKKGGPPGERQTAVREGLSQTKETFDALDEDSNAIDWENVDKTKDRMQAAGGLAKRGGGLMKEGYSDWKDIFTEDGPGSVDAGSVDPDRAGLQFGHRRAEGHEEPDWVNSASPSEGEEGTDSADTVDIADDSINSSVDNTDDLFDSSPPDSEDTPGRDVDSTDDEISQETESISNTTGSSDPFQELSESEEGGSEGVQETLQDVFGDSPNDGEESEESGGVEEEPEGEASANDRPVPDWVREGEGRE
ncbi:hypothetical protein [Haloarcula sp. Atlit-7R]|uniref:hypothetical protein n=1 Tax=Haloarcula sp. Atlit-7R TaxID=2282125 RepID=UPI000EF13911|nr:hypothetical protein [Haloarcula sp. Atlit-7R]RLM94336.1 hypothetical protein D3D01_15860 [Haloarcula sp. Atlit-7R]